MSDPSWFGAGVGVGSDTCNPIWSCPVWHAVRFVVSASACAFYTVDLDNGSAMSSWCRCTRPTGLFQEQTRVVSLANFSQASPFSFLYFYTYSPSPSFSCSSLPIFQPLLILCSLAHSPSPCHQLIFVSKHTDLPPKTLPSLWTSESTDRHRTGQFPCNLIHTHTWSHFLSRATFVLRCCKIAVGRRTGAKRTGQILSTFLVFKSI